MWQLPNVPRLEVAYTQSEWLVYVTLASLAGPTAPLCGGEHGGPCLTPPSSAPLTHPHMAGVKQWHTRWGEVPGKLPTVFPNTREAAVLSASSQQPCASLFTMGCQLPQLPCTMEGRKGEQSCLSLKMLIHWKKHILSGNYSYIVVTGL